MASALARLLVDHREQLDALDNAALRRFLRAYTSARRDIREKLDAISGDKEWSHANLHVARLQIEDGIRHIARLLGKEVAGDVGAGVRLGVGHLEERFEALSKRFSGIAVSFNVPAIEVLSKREDLLLSRVEKSRRSYGDQVIESVSAELTAGALARESPSETLTRVMRVGGFLDGEQWRAARIVRTELTNAHELGTWEAGALAIKRGDLPPETNKRMISVFDNRTGIDSYEQHGQTVRWHEPFIDSKRGFYLFPPNRPNDRATTVPWLPEWGDASIVRAPGGPAPGAWASLVEEVTSYRVGGTD